ncbi:cholecystokinin receptor type A-like [Gigantopelta aegis]|uniref:cholecystokinin receptor type A-like n=1 Tax=Gigantopelta aegis TaxID=1735272 RepID=UPI001B887FDB|nr:cholecystokinin receptor type A-like [Gigantopelta aegis]
MYYFNDSNASFYDNVSDAVDHVTRYSVLQLSAEIQIALYSIIFLLSVTGNILIIVTLIQNKRMRTVTNVFLLNLAISDLLLAVFCMPFTLVPVLLQNFIFGAVMCVMIRYLQAVSVGVSCFTLVAISMERYYAICQPLHSRAWQTLSHSYRYLGVCWLLAFISMTPVAVFQKFRDLPSGSHSCRERWPNPHLMKAYTVFLDLALLIIPVLFMSVAYGRVIHTLATDVRDTSYNLPLQENGSTPGFVMPNYRTLELRLLHNKDSTQSISSQSSTDTTGSPPLAKRSRRIHRMRHTNPQKIRQNKIRVIKMLFAVVLEFFICWTPVYIINTWMMFDAQSAAQHMTPLIKSLFHLLSYASSCCNPITYCFMNKKFREAFVRAFQCRTVKQPLRDRRRMLLASASRRSELSMFQPGASTSTRASSIRQPDFGSIRETDFNDMHGLDD